VLISLIYGMIATVAAIPSRAIIMTKFDINKRDRILLKIRQASDLPALADTVHVINEFKASEDTSVSDLANILLKDYALTTKLLKVVNSVYFMQAGQVTTISRAIFLLGIDHIKQIALTLMLFEQLQKNKSQAEIMETIIKAFCGGVIARKFVQDLNYVEEEEAFICALLHPLGKVIVAHTMPEMIAEIRTASLQQGISEEQASVFVLGISFEEIGTTIATEWNYPQKIVKSMHHTSAWDIPTAPREDQKLSIIATLATELSNLLATDADNEGKKEKIKNLLSSYKGIIPKQPRDIDMFISSSVRDFKELVTILDLNLKKSAFSKQLDNWSETIEQSATETEVLSFKTDSLKTIDTLFVEEAENPETIFSKGIQDINNSMQASYTLNDVIHIALETIYRGLQMSQVLRVLFFVKDIKEPRMVVRYGFGSHVNETKKWFIIHIGKETDIFNVALSRATDLVVKDTTTSDIKKFIPLWYKDKISIAGYIMIFPVTVSQKNIGLICIEGATKGFSGITRSCLNYLKILRDQIVIATRQSLR
jgi:eukaryotic-like serine/threonine-protein kinase